LSFPVTQTDYFKQTKGGRTMKSLFTLAVPAVVLLAVAAAVQADVIAGWTFETSFAAITGSSTDLTGLSPETGAGTASSHHATASTFSSPAGNGSAKSFSSNTWAVGDYYQFQVATTALQGIAISWDQTSSNTGPRDFTLQYSTDGSSFSDFASYSVLANGAPNTPWSATSARNAAFTLSYDLSAITGLDNQATVYFRLADNSTVSANAGVVAAGGTDRVDNVTVSTVPEPLTASLLLVGGLMGLIRRRS